MAATTRNNLPGAKTMRKQFKPVRAVVAMTLVLGLPIEGLAAEDGSAKAGEAQPRAEDIGPELREAPPSNGIRAIDAFAVRPVTFVSSVFSTGVFVLALPFAALDPALDAEKMGKTLVEYPFGDTFKRPLGDFSGSAW